ncbi:hypothetical protein CBS101457_002204 [Exobasidium rhododendri]|nr:hypothetical protein CBS101457_002204 [Exobasidium rhododendri]
MSKSLPFRLSVQLDGHTADVRCVAATHVGDALDSLIVSASRDESGRIWSRPSGSKSKRELSCKHILEGHGGFVNSCAWIKQRGTTLALTGGQDRMINAYEIPPASSSKATTTALHPNYTLLGHDDNVCALDVFDGPNGYIVSGSWDKTARIWKDWECCAVLAGHTQAVWAVLALTDDLVLTASADKMIRLYSIKEASLRGKKSAPIAIFAGHNDAVRGLARISDTQFASCSNDGNINIFPIPSNSTSSSSLKLISTLSGHTSFVYSLAMLSDGTLASSGEDRSVRIWKDGTMQQTITIPAISVWSVAGMANGDFVCASSDGAVRVFTQTQQRFADPEELEVYEANVSSQALNKTQVGDVQKENLPGVEVLTEPGKEGQVKMVRSGDVVEAYQYSTTTSKWEKIGEVVGGVGSGQKKLYQGKEYDYVFDVDIADGVPPLKLPYNATENPYNAAQRFLEKNELPQTYLDQVVQFIEKNSEAVSLGSNNEFVDPYTGTSSYRPGGGSSATSAPVNVPATSTARREPSQATILPQKTPLSFKQFNEQGARAKIEEFNGQLTGTVAMTAQELLEIQQLLPTLSAVANNSNPSISISLATLQQVLGRWPLSHRFPLLDIYRLACSGLVQGPNSPAIFALQASQWSAPWPSNPEEAKMRGTLSLLALRAVCNLLSTSSTSLRVEQIVDEVQQGSQFSALSKPARVAYASVLLNLSIKIVTEGAKAANDASKVLHLLTLLFESEKEASSVDGEVIYRALIAFGNLLVSPSSGSLPVGEVGAAKASAEACASLLQEPRIKTIMAEVRQSSSLL